MKTGRSKPPRHARGLLASTVLAAGILAATSVPASAAVTSSFSNGVLTVNGDSLDNTITVSRNAAGQILVNGGAVPVIGGPPTVANTSQIKVFGLGGQDVISLNQASGALPAAHLFGGPGNDVLTGGCGRRPAVRRGRQRHAARCQGGFDFLFGGDRERHADRR